MLSILESNSSTPSQDKNGQKMNVIQQGHVIFCSHIKAGLSQKL